MSGLSTVAALLLNILVVRGNVFLEETYLKDRNHIEHQQNSYSDYLRSDYFGNALKTDLDIAPEVMLRYERSRLDYKTYRKIIPDWFLRLTNTVYTVPNRPIESLEPDTHSMNADGAIWPTRPSESNGEGRNRIRRNPGAKDRNKLCRNIIGLPNPESGCCGVQETQFPTQRQHPGYPRPVWPIFDGERFRRSTDNESPNKMIRGGRATDLYQLPWTVRLAINPRLPGLHSPDSCGGTILSSRYVLTAAHCLHNTFKDISQLEVFLAEYDTYSYPKDCINKDGKRQCVKNKVMKVDHVILHKDYNDTFLQNDVALLRLSSDIPYTSFIRPICLPTADIAELREKDTIIAGWGLNGKTESNLKQAAFVKFVSNDKCKEQYSYKDDSMFCSIGEHGEDICHGDSGGPLMVMSNNTYFLSGVVNGKRKDHECGSAVSSIFNNVFYHKDWIVKHVK